MLRIELLAIAGLLATAAPAMAQGRGNSGVPPGQMPRTGMCRIWIDGLPPGRQPAATDCATAMARVPSNGRVLYGARKNSGRHVNTSNGQIETVNGQTCVQRVGQNGVLRVICPDGTTRRDDRADRRKDDRDDQQGKKVKKPRGDRGD